MTISDRTAAASGLNRRQILGGVAAGVCAVALPGPALASLTLAQARELIDAAVADVTTIINSGRTEAQMIEDFERVFRRYGDVPTIARSALGPPARSASPAQLAAFTDAFAGYMARKWGRQFRTFIGGRVRVTGGRAVQSFFEVISVSELRGFAPFEVRWHVSDRSGQNLFFNMIIEGVNLLSTERVEMAAMLERRRGNLDQMIADLRRAG